MTDGDGLFVVKVSDGATTGPLAGSRGDVQFPEEVRGWSDVLDCRLHPFAEKDLPQLRHFGAHVNKRYLLVSETVIRRAPLAAAPEVSTVAPEDAEE